MKILAIKFKYLGDVAIMVPALRALRKRYPNAELHVLVAAEAYPLLTHIPWLDKIWNLPRTRGKIRLNDSLPIIRALRAQSFDCSVDFVGNDRGAILSRSIGAKKRLGVRTQLGNQIRRLAYTDTIEELDHTRHEVLRDYYVLSEWQIPPPSSFDLELYADPTFQKEAQRLYPESTIICHLSTSQRKKEWPINHWALLADLAESSKIALTFSSGPTDREQALLTDLKKLKPDLNFLKKANSVDLYMAILARAKLFISPDTAPLHLAAGLGIPTIGIFGPTAPSRWGPPGKQHHSFTGNLCPCSGHLEQCELPNRCIDSITAHQVFEKVKELL